MSLNINDASYHELIKLPGIGPKTADSIVEYRNVHGIITPEILASIPYIRFSSNLVSLLDFSTDICQDDSQRADPVDDA